MNEPTLESLAARIAELERKLAEREVPAKDWRRTIGMFADDPFMAIVDAEVAAAIEADREAGRNKQDEEIQK